MIRIYYFLLLALSFSLGCASCPSFISITIPAPVLTGEKTSIERQIVGEYKELEKEAWIVSSSRTMIQDSKSLKSGSTGDIKMFKAMKIREFHYEKIRKYKSEGSIGETNIGFIKYRKTEKYESNIKNKNILSVIIKNENNAREVIFIRSLIQNGIDKPSRKEIKSFGRIFAKETAVLALKNDWIQNEGGGWYKK